MNIEMLIDAARALVAKVERGDRPTVAIRASYLAIKAALDAPGGTALATARARERGRCANACAQISQSRWDAFKNGPGPEKDDPAVAGQSEGADACSDAILALPSEEVP